MQPDSNFLLENIRCSYLTQWARKKAGFIPDDRGEEGQSLAIIALSMMLFVGLLGLVIDYGHATLINRKMQVAADLAALAGARELAADSDGDTIVSRIQQVLTQNGADAQSSVSVVSDGDRVTVTAQQNVETIFASILGIDSIEVKSSAQALVGVAASSLGLMPFAVEDGLWDPGELVSLWGQSNGAGNFGWVRWTGQSLGVSNLRYNIDSPERSDDLVIGDWVSGNPGVSFRAVQPNLNRWIDETITVFLYDPDEVIGQGANLQYRVVGFAQFQIASTSARGSGSEIVGSFLEYVSLGGDLEPLGSPGTRTVTLVQ
ncbi:MAG: hypothetical protein KJZ86_24100 [Caldilineaceae bacterium]|nr:hypothetical protein [Caldilineaceae bacterium]HRJ40412.1 pilus assembly protein TadG-related protein [Caldilineaceae bacterium]